MTVNLSSYRQLESILIVRIDCQYYKPNPYTLPERYIMRFSDNKNDVLLNVAGQNELFTGIGSFMSITNTKSELRPSSSPLTISISGIPNEKIAEIMNSKFKGSSVGIWRVIVDPATKQPLNITGNPVGRFFGVINNYGLSENYDNKGTCTNTISLFCSSFVDILNKKLSGRRTNPRDMQAIYPNDLSFDRVSALQGANFNFGAPSL